MTKNQKNQIKNKILLVILDGWGIAPASSGNAISLAKKPFYDSLLKKYPVTQVCAHGKCVGLPKNQPGNSEAGHLNLGTGRVVKDDAVYIDESIQDGTFFKNPAFQEGLNYLKKYSKNKPKIHLMGLVTEENSAHSSPEHWLAMLRFLEQKKVSQVYLHLFTDGRDSSQHAAIKILERFGKKIKNNHNGHKAIKVEVASIVGRFYAMDRTKRWERIKKVYELLTEGKGLKAPSPEEAVLRAYNRKETDEFIQPTVIIDKKKQPIALIENHDLIFFMNLRSDRARELTKVFVQKEFQKMNPNAFKRKRLLKNLFFIALTDFGPDLDDVRSAYPSRAIKNSLTATLKGLKQLYISETEKYAHVTFFFNGGYAQPIAEEERIVIPSPMVQKYDQKPEMSTKKLTNLLIKKIKTQKPDFITINYCNTDMIGHTGNLSAAIKTIECLDQNLKRLIKVAQQQDYSIIITADHGNVEEMINQQTGEIETKHTTNPVPVIILTKNNKKIKLNKKGSLSDIAPTILDLFGIQKPKEMTGKSLIK